MGTSGKLVASRGCDYVTGTEEFTARNGHIFMFRSADNLTEIGTFDELPVEVVNDAWVFGADSTAVTYATDERTYLNVALPNLTEIWFDGPVTALTLAAGSGWVYYN